MKVQTGEPVEEGLYVTFVDALIEKNTQRILLLYVQGLWGYPGSDQLYRGKIYGWIGPLPLKTKKDFEKQDLIRYGIGTIKSAKKGSFSDGPYKSLKEIKNVVGIKGEYIFQLTEKNEKPILKWSSKKNKWVGKK